MDRPVLPTWQFVYTNDPSPSDGSITEGFTSVENIEKNIGKNSSFRILLFELLIFCCTQAVSSNLVKLLFTCIIVQPDQVVNANGPAFGCVQMKDYHKALAKRLKHNNTAYENYHRIFVPEGHPLKAEPREPLRANVMFKLIQKMLSGETAVIAETGLVFNCQKLKLPKGWCKQLSECD